jgi:quinol monooxygenase YgiN
MPKEDVHAIALLNARSDKTEELNSLLTSLLEPTRQESGCIRFELTQNRATPTEFAIVSQWHNEQAVQDHIGTGYAQRAMSRLPELLADPMDLRFYHLWADVSPPRIRPWLLILLFQSTPIFVRSARRCPSCAGAIAI